MSMLTDDRPFDLMTLEQWDALEVAHTRRWELSEGTIIMSPRPQLIHQDIAKRLTRLLDDHLPEGMRVLPEIEVTTSSSFPPSVRNPDITMIRESAFEPNSTRVPAADVALVIEIVSPGSRRMDTVMKLHEYAKAGIEHYWIVDVEAPSSEWFLAFRLDGEVYRSVSVRDGDHVQVREPADMRFTLADLTD